MFYIIVKHFTISKYGIDQFNEDSKHILEAWITQNQMPNDENLETVINNGAFEITKDNPMKFRVGTIFNEYDKPAEDYEYTFIICKLDVGRPFVFSKKKLAENGGKQFNYLLTPIYSHKATKRLRHPLCRQR